MDTWKQIVKVTERYKTFTILEEPKKFRDMFRDQDIPVVQLHSVQVYGDGSDIVGFCGVFQWKDNAITPIDGDIYSQDVEVLGYEWFEHQGEKCLDILVGDDW